MNTISCVAILTSFMFVALSYVDHSAYDPCCKELPKVENYCSATPEELAQAATCTPGCNEYYMVRMPRWFHTLDMVICLIFLLEHLIRLYISPNRCSYFMSLDSILTMVLIIFPAIIFNYDAAYYELQFQSFSRIYRISKCTTLFKTV